MHRQFSKWLVTAMALGALVALTSPAYGSEPRAGDAPTIGPLISLSPAEFLKLPDTVQAIYVGGVIDGVTYTSYGYSLPDHDRYIHCVRSLTLGALADKTAAWLRANPTFIEGTATAVAKTLGAYCKEKGFR